MANEETIKNFLLTLHSRRTISYRYDGEHLDWDEVERVIPQFRRPSRKRGVGLPTVLFTLFLSRCFPRVLSRKTTPRQMKAGIQTPILMIIRKNLPRYGLHNKEHRIGKTDRRTQQLGFWGASHWLLWHGRENWRSPLKSKIAEFSVQPRTI